MSNGHNNYQIAASRDGGSEIYTPAALASYETSVITQERDIVAAREEAAARQDRENKSLQLALRNQETALQQRARELAVREERVRQDEDTYRRREEDFQKRIAEFQRQRQLLDNDRQALAQEREVQRRKEEQRRSRRTPSETFLEDALPNFGLDNVVKHLGNSSARIRRHVMVTLTPLTGQDYARKHPAEFDTVIRALLPTSLPLLRSGKEDVVEFVSGFLSEKYVDLALAKAGQCSALFEMLLLDEPATSLASGALTNILTGDDTCRLILHTALFPHLRQPAQPVLKFAMMALPTLIESIILEGQYQTVVDYTVHASRGIRSSAYPAVTRFIETSPAIRRGLVQQGLLPAIHCIVQADGAPDDIVNFAATIMSSLAMDIFRAAQINLLLDMICSADNGLQSACGHTLISLRKVNPHTRESLRIALEPRLWSADGMDEVLRIFALDTMPQIATDLITMGRFEELLKYLDLEDADLRDAILSVVNNLAHESPDLQKNLLDAGLLGKLRPVFLKENPPPDFLSFASQMLPAFGIQICRAGSTAILVELVSHSNISLASAAVNGLRRVLHCDARCRQAVQYALEPYLTTPQSKVLDFAVEALPLIANDALLDNRHEEVLPILAHENAALRRSVMPTVLQLIQAYPTQQKQLSRAGIMTTFSPYLASPSPPDDISHFLITMLPLLAPSLAESGGCSQLIDLLGNPPFRRVAAECIRKVCSSGENGQQALVEADILPKLLKQLPQSQESITGLLCELLPALSVRCCRQGQSLLLIELAGSTNANVRRQALAGIRSIVTSSLADRILLRQVLLLQLGPEEHILNVVDIALLAISKDLASAGELHSLIELATHAEPRIRQAAYPSLRESIRDSALARQALVDMGFVPMLIRLCSSPVGDRVDFATSVTPLMALEASRGGFTSKIMELFDAEIPEVRQALYVSLINISRGTKADQEALLDAGLLDTLARTLRIPRRNEAECCDQVLPSLAERIGGSANMCTIVLQFLSYNHALVRSAATRTLDMILSGPSLDRQVLRQCALSQLSITAHPNILNYISKALFQAFCPDLMREGKFKILFDMLSYPVIEIRSSVVRHLQSALRNEATTERLASAGLFRVLLELLPIAPPDIISFSAEHALPALSPFLIEVESNCSAFIALLAFSNSDIRQSVAAGLRRAAETSESCRQRLVEADLILRLVAWLDMEDSLIADLTSSLLPKMAVELAQAEMCEVLLDLLSHQIASIRRAALHALQNVIGTDTVKAHLVKPMLGRSGQLRDHEVAFFCKALVQLNDTVLLLGEEKRLLALLWHTTSPVSESAYSAVRALFVHGSSFERRKLLDAQMFNELCQMLGNTRLRSAAILLTLDVLPGLIPLMVQTGQFDQLIKLFGDADPQIIAALDKNLRHMCANSTQHLSLVEQDAIPRLLSLLEVRAPNEAAADIVRELVCYLCQLLAVQMVDFNKASSLVSIIRRDEPNLRYAAIMAIQKTTSGGMESVRSSLFLTESFLPGISHVLNTDRNKYNTMRVVCEILTDMAASSVNRTNLLVSSGIASSVLKLCEIPDLGLQTAAMTTVLALCTLGNKIVLLDTELTAALNRFLGQPPSSRIAELSLQITSTFAQDIKHRQLLSNTKLLYAVVTYLMPKDEADPFDQSTRDLALEICHAAASQSDKERGTLLDAGILPLLLQLTEHSRGSVVVLACSILEAIGSSGTYRKELIDADVPKYLKRKTRLMHKSTLSVGEDKRSTQKAAKQALSKLDPGVFSTLGRKLSRKHTSRKDGPHRRPATSTSASQSWSIEDAG